MQKQDAVAKGVAPAPKPPANLYPQTGPKPMLDEQEEMVYVWPHLVSIEAIMAILVIFALAVLSAFVNAPLLDLANPELTPNPAKAPWYFLGLQELLLHMHPALAGVIVPTVVLVGLAAAPYLDRSKAGTGIWFSTVKGKKIAIFSAIYTVIWELGLIFIDEWGPVPGKPDAHGLSPLLTYTFGLPEWVGQILFPSLMMTFIPWLLLKIVNRRYKPNTREKAIALFTFFLASFVLLTIIGTAFRGESMRLMWPWQLTH